MPARSRPKSASTRAKEKPFRTDDTVSDDFEKENKSRTIRTRSKPLAKPTSEPSPAQSDTYCICDQPDDGSPMVCCSVCNEWYHFRCVNLSVEQAEDLEVYVCPSCTENTGRHMIMQWDGPEACPEFINLVHDDVSKGLLQPPTPPPALSPSESEEDPDSEDEYVAESEFIKMKRPFRRRTRHAAYATDSDHDSDTQTRDLGSRKHSTPFFEEGKASPSISSHLKRKPTISHQARESKRKKSSDAPVSVDDDPARKYCLGKLRDMFCPVFLRYPLAVIEGPSNKVELNPENLTDEDKQRLHNGADVFSLELEQCLFELYGEPDKHGKQGVGPKYKERFRMLNFNLSQADRVAIHKRICYGSISAKELSQMSSTDLANEETKQSIKLAEKEALEHSILQKTLIPRAKITHKGLQDIEDVNGESTTLMREREKEREKEEEERRERERQARLKAAEQHQRERASSISQGSIPPESPIAPQSATWTGPLHMHHGYSPPIGDNIRPPIHPLFAPSTSDIHTSPEPELDIAELIHLDDEPAPQDTFGDHLPTPALALGVSPMHSEFDPPAPASPKPVPPPPLTIPSAELSPVIATSPTQPIKPETPARASFDLNALWTSPKTEALSQDTAKEPESEQEQKSHPMEVDTLPCEATDQDFDIFLEKDQDTEIAQDGRPQDPEAAFQAVAPVWVGKIAMPVDSSIPQLAPVVARQVGGRTLSADSPLWRTLFPSDTLRIDGRVPIENSSQFLLQTRLNPQKELIACAFSSEGGDDVLQTFSDFLLHKNRHGLVFPWGHQPKDYHPGKELYMVPLLASMPLPDFIELLDELRLPKVRQNNYVIGIWILVRGKLAPPPAPPSTPLAPGVAQPPPQPSTPTSTPSLPAALQAYPQLANSALAAEVAALTPEQIQAIIRALSSGNGGIPGISGGLANAVANVAQAPHPPPLPLPLPLSHPSVPTTVPTPAVPQGQPRWAGGVPGFPVPGLLAGPNPGSASVAPGPAGAFPPGPPPPPSPRAPAGPSTFMSPHARTPPQLGVSPHGPGGIHPPPVGPRSGGFGPGQYDRDDPDARYRDERGERAGGWPQQSNGRGRGRRSRGRSSSSDFMGRPVDAGWTRHRGGPGGSAQDERARWDGPSPPRRWG